ncbi:sensor histidine kinase [Anaerorhabdus furcosa]|uniref:histidine kinase n=1 Tax=Anaerorhabdus furcosa TaxID=118967 RepID=A0A1T4Q782_9FIRM|nr:HAMP domain-containing sensor histidine kinase [Anaerorhabdus furcosa]SJZ99595.1 Signal transduction histidine kinase [Anaerorhabdus furcosa]
MRHRLRGIKFNVWLDFFLFALAILLILGILQFSLIKPYYRNNKITTIQEVATKLESYIVDNDGSSEYLVDKAFQVAVNNSVCAAIFNEQGKLVYSADGLGQSCIFNQKITLQEQEIVPFDDGIALNEHVDANFNSFSEVLINSKSKQEMILFGEKIESNLGNLYLYINSPLEPVDSIISFFQEQYFFYTLIIIGFSILISVFISNGLSKPIVKMKSSADSLSKADYENTHFEGSYFREINDLATTLNEATHKLEKVDELRKDLIANVSHDIKTPLTMIKAYAEMIRDISGDNPKKREEHLDVIIQEVDYLDHLVLDMQELSKMQSGNYELNRKNFDIVEKIKSILTLFQVLIDEHHFQVSLESDESIILYADEIKIGQVIYNFLSNSFKHSDDYGKIFVRIIKKDDCVRIEVEDEGSGIPEESIPYIWDRYYKIDKSFKRATVGTGLGLAIVKAILDNHEAQYGVVSEEGKGSTFWFELAQENVF